jgi:hypothetical protein
MATTRMPGIETELEGITDKVSSTFSEAQEKAQEAGRNALNKIDQKRESTAETL